MQFSADSAGGVLRKLGHIMVVLLCALCAGQAVLAAPAKQAAATPKPVDLAQPVATLQLGPLLTAYHAPGAPETDNSVWYIVNVTNSAARAVTRIFVAGEPADAALHIMPRATRATLLQLASSDGGIAVERQPVFGDHAYRVTVPAGTTAALALRLGSGGGQPSVLAWSEGALAAHHRQLAIFVAAVAGLIAAAAAIAGGVAALTGHAAARWAALTLLGLFVLWLATAGLLDESWNTSLGGPYGFAAMLGGLTLAAGTRLVEEVAPLSDLWPWAEKYRRWSLIGLVGVSFLAFVGVPAATLLVNIAVLFGTAGLAAYLVRRGMEGAQAARVLAPSAAVFALVVMVAALAAIGGFRDNPIAAEIVGGFAAAGAVLVALAIAAGEWLGLIGKPAFAPAAAAVAGSAVPASESTPEPAAPAKPAEPPSAALAAIGASHQGVYDLDFRADSLKLSAEAAALIGVTKGALTLAHSSWVGRIHAEDRAIYKDALRDYRDHPGLAFRIEFRVRSESGRYPWFELRATMMGEGERAEHCLGLIADVTSRKEAEAAVIDRTLRDPLTGLGNRAALMEELEQLGRRPRGVLFAVLDIDRFKSIHASLGDEGADAVLRHVAERLTRRYESTGRIFRIGGDAFAILLTKGARPDALAGELLEMSNAPLVENGRKVFAPASVGIASGVDVDEPLDLLRNAELALRQAKRHGGACARTYTSEMDASIPADAVALEAELRRALDEGQLDLFYQPIMRLADRTVAGFEALLRWHHPERGLVWPSDFIGHSEETGLIVALGKFALSRAADDLARWQQFFPVEPPLFVSVNVSRRQLQDSAFEAHLAQVLKKSTLAPGSLRLEVTESAIAASGQAQERLTRMREIGAGLAIDDFGTGLSSLSQLKEIPFDVVKVDKSFLTRPGEEAGDADVILNSIVGLAHELKRDIVVEGVESEEDAERLRGMGCEFAQGFHFSVPLPAREALNFIALHYDSDSAEAPADGSGAPGVGG